MSVRSARKKQRRRNLREMRMNKRKRRSLVDYSTQNMRIYQESLERKRKKPMIVVIYERQVMEKFTPSWSLPKRLIIAVEKVKQNFKPKYHIPRSKLPDSLIDPDSFPQTNYDTAYISVNDMTYVFPSMEE